MVWNIGSVDRNGELIDLEGWRVPKGSGPGHEGEDQSLGALYQERWAERLRGCPRPPEGVRGYTHLTFLKS